MRETKKSEVINRDGEINWNTVKGCLRCHATDTEVAALFDLTPGKLYRRAKRELGVEWRVWAAQQRAAGKTTLRRKQFELALNGNGNPIMLIWLGKQYLGQSDVATITNPNGQQVTVNVALNKFVGAVRTALGVGQMAPPRREADAITVQLSEDESPQKMIGNVNRIFPEQNRDQYQPAEVHSAE